MASVARGVNKFSHFARRFRLRSPLFEELMYYSELFSDYHKDMEIYAAISINTSVMFSMIFSAGTNSPHLLGYSLLRVCILYLYQGKLPLKILEGKAT